MFLRVQESRIKNLRRTFSGIQNHKFRTNDNIRTQTFLKTIFIRFLTKISDLSNTWEVFKKLMHLRPGCFKTEHEIVVPFILRLQNQEPAFRRIFILTNSNPKYWTENELLKIETKAEQKVSKFQNPKFLDPCWNFVYFCFPDALLLTIPSTLMH